MIPHHTYVHCVDKFVASSLGGDYFCSLCGSKFHFKSKLERHLRCDAHKLFCSFIENIQDTDLDDDNLPSESEKVKHFTKYTIDYITIPTRMILQKQNLMMIWVLLALEEAVIVMTITLMKQIQTLKVKFQYHNFHNFIITIIIIIITTTTTTTTTSSYFIASRISALLDEKKNDDYFPFPNKIFALLYCFLHSPRPIVSQCSPVQ